MSQFSSTAKAYPSARRNCPYPKRVYNPFLKPTFDSFEDEDLWFHMSRSLYLVKPIVCSLVPHKPTLVGYHAKTELYDLFENVELDIDLVMSRPAYKELVYQFIASFKVTHNGAPYGENSVWEFRIQNTNFSWTRRQAKEFLDFPMAGEYNIPTEEESTNFWEKISGLRRFGDMESPFSIQREHWQFVHRLVATNINCQPDSNDCVTLEDLELMWAINLGAAVDWFHIFSSRFLSMKDLHGNLRFVGCTSLITLIAECCGFEFSCCPYESRVLDYAHWKKLSITARPLPNWPNMTEESEEDPSEEHFEDQEEEDPSEKAEEPTAEDQEEGDPSIKKQRIEVEMNGSLNEKIDWTRVRKVTVYEF